MLVIVQKNRFMVAFLRTEPSRIKREVRRWCAFAVICGAILCLAGCGSGRESPPKDGPPPTPAKVEPVAESPEDVLYAQLRSGAFQLSAAAGSIEDSLVAAQEAIRALGAFRDQKEAMEEVAAFIDSAGSSISEFTDDPPAKEEIAKDFATFDELRLRAVEASNDALQDLRQSLGVLEGLSDGSNREAIKWAGGIRALVAVALDDLWGAIEALGGTPEAAEASTP